MAHTGRHDSRRTTAVALTLAFLAGLLVTAAPPADAQVGPLQCGAVEESGDAGTSEVVVASSHVGMTWAGHYVDQALLTADDEQYVGYYNADRQMTVAHRNLADNAWTEVALDETLGWDSHNYLTMAVDRAGHLHVAGNMHNHALKYFRTAVAGDITSLTRVTTMVNPALEGSVTYPVFLELGDGTLVFRYREGGSGSGIDIYNQYDEATGTWAGLLDSALLDGQGQRNAYAAKPTLGPDGNYHLVWVWRDSPNAATTNTVSYARSADLVNWETSRGEPLSLPITYATGDVVDPVPPFGGTINNNVQVGFDQDAAPIVAYHRYDDEGNTQVYVARPDDSASGWHNVQVSDWTGAWEFSAGGTLVFEVEVYWSPEVTADGTLRLDVTCRGDARTFLIDPVTLAPIEEIVTPPTEPTAVTEVRSTYEHPPSGEVGTQMRVNLNDDSGGAGSFHARPLLPDPGADSRFLLRWESLGENQDQPRSSWPPAQPLSVVTLGHGEPEPPNLALQGENGAPPSAFADHFQTDYPPSFLNDGDLATFWVSAGTQAGDGPSVADPVMVGIDLGDPMAINQLTLVPRPGAARHPRDFTVEVSENGDDWSEVARVVDSPTDGHILVDLPRSVARMVRLVVTESYPGALLDQAPNTQLAEIEVRNLPAQVAATLDAPAPDGNDGWYVTPVAVHLASDTDTSLRLRAANDAAWTVWEDEPVLLAADGEHNLTFGAFLGDAQEPAWHAASHHLDVRIDATAPTTTAALSPQAAEQTTVDGQVTVTLSGQDQTSGLDRTEYRIGSQVHTYEGPLVVTAPGTHTVDFRSVDVAGNVEPWQTVTFAIADEATPPPVPTPVCARHQGRVTFPDSPGSGHQFFIDCLAALQVVGGFTDGTYGPRGEVTRGQLASFVVRAVEHATQSTLPAGGARFADVDPGATHGQAIYKLRNAGVIQGYTDGTFRPAHPVTRDQTARYVTNALEHVLDATLPTSNVRFPDVAADNRYAQDIDKLVTAEVVGGFGDGTFGPRLEVTRGQMARFIANAIEVLNDHGAYRGD